MQTYELQYNQSATAGPLMAVTLIGGTIQASLLEFGIASATATVPGTLVLGRPASNGTGSAGTPMEPLNPSDPAASTAMQHGAFATTQPTAPTNPFRQFVISGGSGIGTIWGWDVGELIIPAAGQLVLWIVSGTIAVRGYAKVAEGG
jgi:hypothetical protein